MKPHRYFTPCEWHAFPFLDKTHTLPRKEGNLQSGHQRDYTTRVKPLSLRSLLLSFNPACAGETPSLTPTQRSLLAAPCHRAASRTPKREHATGGHEALSGKKRELRNLSAEAPSRGRALGLGRALRHLPSCSRAERGEAERSPGTAASPLPLPLPVPAAPGGTPRPRHPPAATPTGGRHGAGRRGRGRSRCPGAAPGALAPPAGGSARGRPCRGRFLGPAGGCLLPAPPRRRRPGPGPGQGFQGQVPPGPGLQSPACLLRDALGASAACRSSGSAGTALPEGWEGRESGKSR